MSLANLSQVKHIVLVLSGKGGVGKSTVSVQLALSLVLQGFKVGIMDIDLCGPSIPRLLGVEAKPVHQASSGWVPVYVDNEQKLCCMSIGFLLPSKDTSVVWRGPKKTSMIQQFLRDVHWGELDYLIIDTPPGTSDEHISVVEYLKDTKPDGAVLVTTPQDVSCADVRKELNFCIKLELPILGLVENMSGFNCPHCSECTNIFSSGGGQSLAEQFKIPFLGAVPIDPNLISLFESNTDHENNQILTQYKDCSIYTTFKGIVEQLTN